jgi:hypothetical protein
MKDRKYNDSTDDDNRTERRSNGKIGRDYIGESNE